MSIEVRAASSRDAPGPGVAVAVPVLSGPEIPEAAMVRIDEDFCRARRFEGKAGQALAMPASGGAVAVAVGLGARDKLDAESLRRGAASVVREVPRAREVVWDAGRVVGRGLSPAAVSQAVAEGACLAAYRFGEYKHDDQARPEIELLTLVGGDTEELAAGAARGARIAEAVSLARDLVNEPAGAMTPSRMAGLVSELAAPGLSVEVMEEAAIEKAGLGGLMGVSRGSSEEPRLVRFLYEPGDGAGEDRPFVALVGKGITFDSGGLSLKTAEGMMTMKTDMSGAAAVVAAMSALPVLRPPVRVLGIVPLTENMPGGRAIKPGDVLRIRNGKTIEVLNTDAEGRLILADALSLAAEERPDAIVDLATLTGACVVALGAKVAGVMGNDEELLERVKRASEEAGEATWHLPLPDEYRSQIDSEVADMKNIGSPREAGALTAGLLLREFVDGVPWVHMDIAGPARSDSDEGYVRKGATGFGVRTIIQLLSDIGSAGPALPTH